MEKWDVIIYLLLIGILLFIGNLVKEKVKIFNRVVLPTALLGGFIGLVLAKSIHLFLMIQEIIF